MTLWRKDIVTRRFTAYSALSIAAVLAACSIAMSTQPCTHSDSNNAQPGYRAVLVELFTSEGCSSCPSADALLQQVNGRYSGSGQLIAGVSEHVTYWNSLGWSDPFSSPIYTERQNAHGQRFRLVSVYTHSDGDQWPGEDCWQQQRRSPSSKSQGGSNVSNVHPYRVCES